MMCDELFFIAFLYFYKKEKLFDILFGMKTFLEKNTNTLILHLDIATVVTCSYVLSRLCPPSKKIDTALMLCIIKQEIRIHIQSEQQ